MTYLNKRRRVLWIRTAVVALIALFCLALWNGQARDTLVFADGRLRPVSVSSSNSRQIDQWRVELEIPNSDLARVRSHVNADEDIDVEFIAMHSPEAIFRGKLRLEDLKAKENNSDMSIGEVRIHSINGDITESEQYHSMFFPDAKIKARIRFKNSREGKKTSNQGLQLTGDSIFGSTIPLVKPS